MKKLITAALFGAFLVWMCCTRSSHRHHITFKAHQLVKAWVWTPGYYRANGVWVRGTWSVYHVHRYMLNRHPRTHIRWVEGRKRPRSTDRPHRHEAPTSPSLVDK